jgi:hypothetical protein
VEVVLGQTWAGRRPRASAVVAAAVLVALVVPLSLVAAMPMAGASPTRVAASSIASLPPGNPIGHMGSVVPYGGDVPAVAADLVVTGWALDPDTASPIYVDLYLDGQLAGRETANVPRADIGQAYPGYGVDHGFLTSIQVFSAGPHQVCAYAINVGAGNGNPLLNCLEVDVPSNPFGHFDSATLEGSGGHVDLKGWAIDPNTGGSIMVDVYVDGHWSRRLPTTEDRVDVGRAYPQYGERHGFDAAFDLSLGTHVIDVYALNVYFGNTNTFLGSKTVTLTGDPIGTSSRRPHRALIRRS